MTMNEILIPVAGINRMRFNLDGNGIRTLIATQGCPLRCKMCINPLTQAKHRKETVYTPRELYDKIAIDKLYFQVSGGGITIGGGEPLLHSKGIAEFCKIVGRDIEMGMETSLNVERSHIEDVVGLFDFYMVDIKTMDPAVYHEYTGSQLAPALDNLKYLIDREGADKVTVRIPLIKGLVDENGQRDSKQRLEEIGVRNFDLFQYTETKSRLHQE